MQLGNPQQSITKIKNLIEHVLCYNVISFKQNSSNHDEDIYGNNNGKISNAQCSKQLELLFQLYMIQVCGLQVDKNVFVSGS